MNSALNPQTGFAHLTDLPCLKLQYGEASAVISLYGAQVLSYKPTAEREVLWLSPKARWHNDAAIRGGIPVCWPWFGPATTAFNTAQKELPNHGLVRNRLWQLVHQHTSANGASVVLKLELTELPHYAGTVVIQLSVTLNETLTVQLSCNSPIPQQAALHSYFNIADIDSVLIRPLPAEYQDKVAAKTVLDNQLSSRINCEVDRIYAHSAAQLRLECATGTLAIGQAGHDATVVWNPWQEKSRAMADMAAGSYQQFVCVETARLNCDRAALSLQQQLYPI
uniref:Putative glucose-6-phosphate 1-epimerase n=1 Tax=Rheinheimera sp. BAL341 TaxID=1708203 RepID=A0A486XSE1_9GAMM